MIQAIWHRLNILQLADKLLKIAEKFVLTFEKLSKREEVRFQIYNFGMWYQRMYQARIITQHSILLIAECL